MKNPQRLCFGLARAAMAAALLSLAIQAPAAVNITALHSFLPPAPMGSDPQTPLIQGNDGNFYGTASGGGSYQSGTFFKITAAGQITILHEFTGAGDGANPRGNLALATNGDLYGTTRGGGTNLNGTVFKITPVGVLTTFYSFSGQPDGALPYGGLTLASDGNFYGTTSMGGSENAGTVFQITPAGAYKSIYSFRGGADGSLPSAPLVQGPDGALYSTTQYGGIVVNSSSYGAIFKITTAGALTPLYAFTDANDGETPYAGLVLGRDGNFYGTAIHGTAGYGSVFQLTASGGFNVLLDFDRDQGAGPLGTLIQGADGLLYGTTLGGGTNNAGAVFAISTNGVFTPLCSLSNTVAGGLPNPGPGPFVGLVQATNGILYGVTMGSGYGDGTIFSVTTNGAYNLLYSFPEGGPDGWNSLSPLVVGPRGLLYGTSARAGVSGDGTIFQSDTNGLVSPLYTFTNYADGSYPSGLALDTNGNLWGTTHPLVLLGLPDIPGAATNGVVFKVATNGALSIIYTFRPGDGGPPNKGGIIGLDGNFYGTTPTGGTGHGSIFMVTPSGAFSNLHSFNGSSEGSDPSGGLLQTSDGNLYGMTTSGPNNTYGVIFQFSPSAGLTVLHTFTGNAGAGSEIPLILADGSFYGITLPGLSGYGAIFRLTLPNSFTNLYLFTNGIDGSYPYGLIEATDGNFYGVATGGGLYTNGTIFKVTAAGDFRALYSFGAADDSGFNPEGGEPVASLVQTPDGAFYGVTDFGGQYGNGTIFRMTLTPPAPPRFSSVSTSNGAVTFSWNAEPGYQYQLQSSADLTPLAWTNIGSPLSTINATLTNSDTASHAQRFYRVVLQP